MHAYMGGFNEIVVKSLVADTASANKVLCGTVNELYERNTEFFYYRPY